MHTQSPTPVALRAEVAVHGESQTIVCNVGDQVHCLTPAMARSLAYRLLEACQSIEYREGHAYRPTVLDETMSEHRPTVLRLPK